MRQCVAYVQAQVAALSDTVARISTERDEARADAAAAHEVRGHSVVLLLVAANVFDLQDTLQAHSAAEQLMTQLTAAQQQVQRLQAEVTRLQHQAEQSAAEDRERVAAAAEARSAWAHEKAQLQTALSEASVRAEKHQKELASLMAHAQRTLKAAAAGASMLREGAEDIRTSATKLTPVKNRDGSVQPMQRRNSQPTPMSPAAHRLLGSDAPSKNAALLPPSVKHLNSATLALSVQPLTDAQPKARPAPQVTAVAPTAASAGGEAASSAVADAGLASLVHQAGGRRRASRLSLESVPSEPPPPPPSSLSSYSGQSDGRPSNAHSTPPPAPTSVANVSPPLPLTSVEPPVPSSKGPPVVEPMAVYRPPALIPAAVKPLAVTPASAAPGVARTKADALASAITALATLNKLKPAAKAEAAPQRDPAMVATPEQPGAHVQTRPSAAAVTSASVAWANVVSPIDLTPPTSTVKPLRAASAPFQHQPQAQPGGTDSQHPSMVPLPSLGHLLEEMEASLAASASVDGGRHSHSPAAAALSPGFSSNIGASVLPPYKVVPFVSSHAPPLRSPGLSRAYTLQPTGVLVTQSEPATFAGRLQQASLAASGTSSSRHLLSDGVTAGTVTLSSITTGARATAPFNKSVSLMPAPPSISNASPSSAAAATSLRHELVRLAAANDELTRRTASAHAAAAEIRNFTAGTSSSGAR
jgi:hypothetical protein